MSINMSADENIQLMRRWFQEVWNEGRMQTVYDLLSPDAVARGQRGAEAEIRGPQEFEKFAQEIRGAFPDIKVKVEDVFGAGDKVVLRWSATMTGAARKRSTITERPSSSIRTFRDFISS
jgi:SnoaL-like polyketide cyclase